MQVVERLTNYGVPVFQYGISFLRTQSKKWRGRKCPIYDPGANTKPSGDSIIIPTKELYLRKVFSQTQDFIAGCKYLIVTGLQFMIHHCQDGKLPQSSSWCHLISGALAASSTHSTPQCSGASRKLMKVSLSMTRQSYFSSKMALLTICTRVLGPFLAPNPTSDPRKGWPLHS